MEEVGRPKMSVRTAQRRRYSEGSAQRSVSLGRFKKNARIKQPHLVHDAAIKTWKGVLEDGGFIFDFKNQMLAAYERRLLQRRRFSNWLSAEGS